MVNDVQVRRLSASHPPGGPRAPSYRDVHDPVTLNGIVNRLELDLAKYRAAYTDKRDTVHALEARVGQLQEQLGQLDEELQAQRKRANSSEAEVKRLTCDLTTALRDYEALYTATHPSQRAPRDADEEADELTYAQPTHKPSPASGKQHRRGRSGMPPSRFADEADGDVLGRLEGVVHTRAFSPYDEPVDGGEGAAADAVARVVDHDAMPVEDACAEAEANARDSGLEEVDDTGDEAPPVRAHKRRRFEDDDTDEEGDGILRSARRKAQAAGRAGFVGSLPHKQQPHAAMATAATTTPASVSRGRVRFTIREYQDIVRGIIKHRIFDKGPRRDWRAVLHDPALHFHPKRLPQHLKDAYRIILRKYYDGEDDLLLADTNADKIKAEEGTVAEADADVEDVDEFA
ncbi:hypothetical protein KFE25_008410 [Diacronema lutheri]|uniref:Uncharacterized protein n=1 Tax=Diacronema lutheri TaxID=2081491 RepID=A0A8J5X3Q5_DIALT|nr:hypothetical protein KFE25_008410 [Diacronema lutheri]